VSAPIFTGERVVPGGTTPANIFQEAEQRYNFASQFTGGRVVLDIACGSGMGSEFLLRAGARQVIGVDIDRQALDVASRRYPKVEFRFGDAAHHIPLPDAFVDVVVSFETIEHVFDQDSFLNECRRVLRDRGTFVCSSPNRDVSQWFPPSRFHVKELRPTEFVGMMQKYFPGQGADPDNSGVFAQRELHYPRLVTRALARHALEALRMKAMLKRLLKIQAEPAAERDQFVECPHGIAHYRRRPFHKPMFLIYVGHKT
jgi:ubiquinone/menaquinone biosynthesis C-methylase UbiE